jgi:hypothetical protein
MFIALSCLVVYGLCSGVDEDVVDVAIDPVLVGLEGLNDGVQSRVEVLGCVLVRRAVAAADVAAGQAEPEMDPAGSHREAFLAALGSPGFDVAYQVDV